MKKLLCIENEHKNKMFTTFKIYNIVGVKNSLLTVRDNNNDLRTFSGFKFCVRNNTHPLYSYFLLVDSVKGVTIKSKNHSNVFVTVYPESMFKGGAGYYFHNADNETFRPMDLRLDVVNELRPMAACIMEA